MRPEAYVATRARIIKGEDQGSGRNGRFLNKRTNGQICRFGLRMADFILSRLRSSSRPASRSGRFIKADGSFIKAGQPMAVLSTMAALSRLRTRPVAAMAARAVARVRSVVLTLGASPSGFPKQFSGRRPASATASLALASVVLALGGGRTGFPKQVSER